MQNSRQLSKSAEEEQHSRAGAQLLANRTRNIVLLPVATAAAVCRIRGRSPAATAFLRACAPNEIPRSWEIQDEAEALVEQLASTAIAVAPGPASAAGSSAARAARGVLVLAAQGGSARGRRRRCASGGAHGLPPLLGAQRKPPGFLEQ